MKKIDVFDQYLTSSRVVNSVTVSCCKQTAARPSQDDDAYQWMLINGVCVRHSSEARVMAVSAYRAVQAVPLISMEWNGGARYRITVAVCCRATLCDRQT